MKKIIALIIIVLFIGGCGISGPSPEELEQIKNLETELKSVKEDLLKAQNKNDGLSGGLIKAFTGARIEILKINEALIQQRIHAIESGVKINIETSGITPNIEEATKIAQEIEEQEKKLKLAEKDALKYTGGLIAVMKQATIATQEQSLAMLRQKYLISKYGLAVPNVPKNIKAGASVQEKHGGKSFQALSPEKNISDEIIVVKLLKKKFTKQDYQEFVFFDLEFKASGLDKPARAIKGGLKIKDLFGEVKLKINWTINKPVSPDALVTAKGTGFKYNQFNSGHVWVKTTNLNDMRASFTVTDVIYQDGTKREI